MNLRLAPLRGFTAPTSDKTMFVLLTRLTRFASLQAFIEAIAAVHLMYLDTGSVM